MRWFLKRFSSLCFLTRATSCGIVYSGSHLMGGGDLRGGGGGFSNLTQKKYKLLIDFD